MKKKPDNPEQSEKFIQAAKELECSEDEKAFEGKLKKILEKKTLHEEDK